MGNAQFASLSYSRWDNENNIIREIKQQLSLYQERGDAIISSVNSLTDSAPVDIQRLSELETQLGKNADDVIKFADESYGYQSRAFDQYKEYHKKLGRDTFGIGHEFDRALRDKSSPVLSFLMNYLQSLWGLLQVNNVILISVDKNNVAGYYGYIYFYRNNPAEFLINQIKAELTLRRSVQDGIIEYVGCHVSEEQRCCDRWTPRGLDFAKMSHKLTYASQYPILMFLSIKNQKNSSNIDRIHEAFKAIAKEVPYFPLIVTNALQDVDPQFVKISKEDEDVQVMMSVFTDATFTSLCDYKDRDSLTIEKFLVKLVMRDYHKYGRKTIEYPRKRIALWPKKHPPSRGYDFAYEYEYNSSKTNGSSLTFQNSIEVISAWSNRIETLTPEKLGEFEVIDASNRLKEFVEGKFVKNWEWKWLNEEAENPNGSLFDVDDNTSDIFFRFLFNIQKPNKMKFLVGVPLYLLQRFLRSSEHVRKRFSQSTEYRRNACNLYYDSVDSLMAFGSLLAYYHVLNESTGIHDQRFTKEQMDRMKTRLKERKAAEKIFVDYFFQPCQVVYSGRHAPEKVTSITASHFPGLLAKMKKFPYVFFLTFVKRYQFVTHEEHRETNQLHVLDLLFDALNSCLDGSDEARRIFRSETRDYDGSTFRDKLYDIVTGDNAAKSPRKLYDFFHRNWEKISLQRFMEKANIKTYDWGVDIKPLDERERERVIQDVTSPFSIPSFEGGQGEATLVYASDIAVPLIAKRFFEPTSQYRDISGEIECLLGNQFNPHIVQVYGCILDKQRFSGILMEYCEGGSLHDYIKRTSSYAEKDILRWTSHASCGLLYLHRNNIVHKDVKPKNMLLDATHKRLKICDFGYSKVTSVSRENNDNIFVTWGERGTPGYIAPEMEKKEDNLTKAVDVFSLGRSVWHMMHRMVPDRNLLPMPVAVPISMDASRFIDIMMLDDVDRRPCMSDVFWRFKEWDREQPTNQAKITKRRHST